ncbi:hypothetical protein NC651_001059 [Populus alba x Populus x berolinensis]|nr:hypothetical protein NC651_001059 [Populus alba x Populus x berolinensis]
MFTHTHVYIIIIILVISHLSSSCLDHIAEKVRKLHFMSFTSLPFHMNCERFFFFVGT